MREVEERTGGRVTIWPATLYGAIRRMSAAGLMEEAESPAAGETDTRRRYYRLTERGRAVLAEETGRLEQLVAIARSKNVVRPTES